MVTAQIASVPQRARMLEQTINSLYIQVDQFNIMLNKYHFTPMFLENDKKITYYHLDNSKGDAAKFYNMPDGVIFLCDDDLIYPTDYVEEMLWKLNEYKGEAIITNHGKIFKDKPIKNYYGSYDRLESFHCLYEVIDEKEVQVGGTGVMCFLTDYFKPNFKDVTIPNIADLWVAKWAKEQGKRIIVNPHPDGWITYQDPNDEIDTIYKQFSENVDLSWMATEFYNSF